MRKRRTIKSRQNQGVRWFFPLLWFFLFLFPALAFPASYSVTFVAPTSPYAGVTYSTVAGTGAGNAVTFNVQAQNPPGTLDASVTDVVNVGFYDTVTGLPAQPQAVFVPAGSGPVTGSVIPMTFVGGKLNFGVTLTAGTTSMDV